MFLADKVAEELDFQIIAGHLTRDARSRLYRQLKLRQVDVEQAESNTSSTAFVEKTISVLLAWRRKEGKDGTVAAIIKAIRNNGDNDVADDLEAEYS